MRNQLRDWLALSVWFTPRRIVVGLIATGLLVVAIFPESSLAVELAAVGACVALLSGIFYGLTFWARARLEIGRQNFRYRIVRRRAGLAALVGLCFLMVRTFAKPSAHRSEVRDTGSSATPDLSSVTPASKPSLALLVPPEKMGSSPTSSNEEDAELLRRFCANNRDATIRVAEFLSFGEGQLEITLRAYPEVSVDEAPDPTDGTHHEHPSTLIDFCRFYARDSDFRTFCAGVESDPKTESRLTREFLKDHEELMRAIRKQSGLEPTGFSELPGKTYDPRSTLADMCRAAGF